MAEIIPFKGILYNRKKISDLSEVITPPYDVISPQAQHAFYAKHPRNVIRLILGTSTDQDTCNFNPHTRAAEFYQQWLDDDTIVQDDAPAFYLTSITFSSSGKKVTRFGIITLVGLEPFEKGIILPHERTFTKVKQERLELMKCCQANFCPIFALFTDRENHVLNMLQASVKNRTPDQEFTEENGICHRLWRITDPEMHAEIGSIMEDKKIFLADGHHRYETALNYRQWYAQTSDTFDASHPANYVMMYLCSIEEPGLIILPAHRMLKEVEPSLLEGFVEMASQYFEIDIIPDAHHSHADALDRIMAKLKRHPNKNILSVWIKDRPEGYVLTLKPNVMQNLFGDELPEELIDLDVTVLTRLILMEMFGFDQERLDNEQLISYSSRPEKALEGAEQGECDIVFLLNPTKIDQVRRVAEQGLVMPRKSTYFFPKVITGQVFNALVLD
jgi:uncharacterized protein (DUF1015 family)